MKQHPFINMLFTVTLLIATVFSAFFAFAHKESCQHETCRHCEEIQEMENIVYSALNEHSDCDEPNCETCVLIAEQIENLKAQKNTEHSCHDFLCDTCVRESFNRHLKTAVYLFVLFVLLPTLLLGARWITKEKALYKRAFTLLELKIRLND